jgi:DNA invertase Pin-like site-specific DNA recombinase
MPRRPKQKKDHRHHPTHQFTEFPKDGNGVIYVRQSSLMQMQKNIHSFELQTDQFERYFREELGCTGHIEIVADDESYSGTLAIHERPGLSRVMNMIKAKKIGWIGAIAVNRLTRDPWFVTPGTLMKECHEHGVWIATLRMLFDFHDEYARRVFMLEAEESARQLDWMKVVVEGSKRAASNNGYYDGRWLSPGYIVNRSDPLHKKLMVYEPHAHRVRWLFRRYLELDGNLRGLAREVEAMEYLFPPFESWVDKKDAGRLKVKKIQQGPFQGYYKPTIAGIQSILTNRIYIGQWESLDGHIVEHNHEALVDKQLFFYAHTRLSSYTLDGKRQKPAMITRNGKVDALLKKVAVDEQGNPVYALGDSRTYRSVDFQDYTIKYRFSVAVNAIDPAFCEKFFERLRQWQANGDLDQWQQNIQEQQAAKEEEKQLIRKQITIATAQRQELLDILADPQIPKTKQMKIEYATRIAGLEERLEQLEQHLQGGADDEDDETILYHIGELIPRIEAKWAKIPFSQKVRIIRAFTHRVILHHVAPGWLKMDIYWKREGSFIDVAHLRRDANKSPWSEQEDQILRDIYPTADRADLLQRFPTRSWQAIRLRAYDIGLRRSREVRHSKHNTILTVNDGYPALADLDYAQAHGLVLNDKKAQWSQRSPY